MSLIKKLAGETAIYGISSILGRILHYILLTPYLTRMFERKEFGIHGELYTYTALLLILSFWRMDTALFRFGSQDSQLNNAFSTAVISVLGSTLLVVSTLLIFASDIAAWLAYPDKTQYVIYFAFIIGFDAITTIPFARLRLQNRPIKYAVIKTLGIIINIVLILFFLNVCPWLIENGFTWVDGFYDESLKLDYVFISNLIASVFVIILLSPLLFSTKLRFDKALWKKMVSYVWPLILVSLAGVVNQSSAVPLQKNLLNGSLYENLSMAGVYLAAAKIAILMNLFATAFNTAAEPFFFNQAKRSDSKEIYAQVAQAFTMVVSVVFLGILLYLDIIKQILIGADFRAGVDEIVPLLLLANLFLGLYYNFSIWYKLTDRTIFGAYISTAAALLTLGLSIFLLPRIGSVGSAWAALACYAFMALAGYTLGQRYFPVPYKIWRIFGYILLAFGFYLISTQLGLKLSSNAISYIGVNTLLLLVYVTGLYFFERKTIKEWL